MERGIGTTPAAGAELANVLPVQIMAPQATKAKASKKSMFFRRLMQRTEGIHSLNNAKEVLQRYGQKRCRSRRER
jgi:hypothetical protein